MRSLKIYSAITMALLLFNQCADHEPVEIDSLSIEEVKSHFSNLPQDQSPNGRKSKIDILWEYGVYKQLEDGELDAITFPIKPEENLYVSGAEDVRRFPVESTAIAFAYKEDGEIKLELLQMVPTTNSDPFTGFVTVNEWGKEVKKAFYYEEGVLQTEPNDDSGRLEWTSCYDVHYTTCQQMGDAPDEGDPCNTHYHFQFCTEYDDLGIYDVLNLGSENGGKSGGNNSSDNGEYCQSPLDPDIVVPCNENTCGPGMEPDGEGGCIEEDKGCAPGEVKNINNVCVPCPDGDCDDCSSSQFRDICGMCVEKVIETPKFVPGRCNGIRQMLVMQNKTDKEVAGFFLADGEMIILPNDESEGNHAWTYDQYTDGGVNYYIYSQDGKMYIGYYDTRGERHDRQIIGHYHTHPYDPDQGHIPSQDDKNFTGGTFADINNFYILNGNGIYQYDGNDNIGIESVNCKKNPEDTDCS